MNTITRRYNTAEATAVVSAQLRDLAVRATKKGISTDLTWSVKRDDEDGKESYVLTVEFSDLVRLAGGWQLVAIADATATDEPLIFKFDDNAHIDGEVDMMRCDHCGRRTHRNKVVFVKSDADEIKQVGGSCSKDFLGHDPFWATCLIEAVDGDVDAHSFRGELDFATEVVISAAIEASRIGFIKSFETNSTKAIMTAMLNGTFDNDDRFKHERDALEQSAPASITARQVLDYMLEQTGDFGDNMRRIAESKTVGRKAFGIIAYAPSGLIKQQQKAQAKQVEEQAKAERTAVPVTSDRIEIAGTITRSYERFTDYGVQYKMIVLDDRGFQVCGTQPASIEDAEVGDRVTFVAKVTVSDRDNTFGFFNRPSKAEIIEQAVVS